MNKSQKMLLSVYLSLTVLVILLDRFYPAYDFVACVKFTIIFSLCLSAIIKKKKSIEQKLMSLTFIFVIIGDLFLVLPNHITHIHYRIIPYGGFGFLFAYIILSYVYQKKIRIKIPEIIIGMIILIVDFIIGKTLLSFIYDPAILLLSVLFICIISYMLWSAVLTIFRDYYTKRVAYYIAISALLMFICDMGVAFQFFHPYFNHGYNVLLNNIIWLAYIPGWTLLTLVIYEDHLIQD